MRNNTFSVHKNIAMLKNIYSMNHRTIRIVLGILFGCLVFGALYYYKGIFIAATVDGSPITRFSVIQRLEKSGGKNVLNSLITEKLINNEAQRMKIAVSDDEINQEIEKIKTSITQQGGTFESALEQQGMTEKDLKNQIKTQKMVEKILADKLVTTDAEIAAFISTNKVTIPKGKDQEIKAQIQAQLQRQKLNQEAQKWLAALKTQSKIIYYVSY